MTASHVESWRDERIRGHQFRGVIDDVDLSIKPEEVIERIKSELVALIVNQVMKELGPIINEALTWNKKLNTSRAT